MDKAKEALVQGTHLLDERQKLILLADKSEFGWKTVEEYTQHELAEDEQDTKKIRCHSGFGPPADLDPPGPYPLADLDSPSQIWTPPQNIPFS